MSRHQQRLWLLTILLLAAIFIAVSLVYAQDAREALGPKDKGNEHLKQFPDWHLSAGHAHPDAASFIIYAQGRVLTGDSGYAGVPMAAHHNTILITVSRRPIREKIGRSTVRASQWDGWVARRDSGSAGCPCPN